MSILLSSLLALNSVESIQGIQGPSGSQGIQGTSGIQGIQGTTGIQGNQGTMGTQGFSGPSTIINASSVTSGTFYPVMVAGTGDNTPSIRSTSTAFSFDANTGELNAASFNSLSDITLKTNLTNISTPLEKILKIDGYKFDWKNSNKSSYGVMAQEIETIFPELVCEKDDLKSVNYNGFIAILIECIKELNSKIKN